MRLDSLEFLRQSQSFSLNRSTLQVFARTTVYFFGLIIVFCRVFLAALTTRILQEQRDFLLLFLARKMIYSVLWYISVRFDMCDNYKEKHISQRNGEHPFLQTRKQDLEWMMY